MGRPHATCYHEAEVIARRAFIASGCAVLAACGRRKAARFPGYAFVANEEGRAVAAVDLAAFAVVRHIGLDGNPAAVIAHPTRDSVYVLTPRNGAVHEIQLSRLRFIRKVQVAGAAVSMGLAPDGSWLWVLCREPRRLVRLDLDRFQVNGSVPLPWPPGDFDISPDGCTAIVSHAGEGQVSFLDLARLQAKPAVPAGGSLSWVRFRSDGKLVLAGETTTRTLGMLDAADGTLLVRLPLAVRPDHFCFKSDGGQLFITGEGMDAVVVVYPYSTEVAETVLAGHAPGAMAASDRPDYLFVANPQSGDVTILDLPTRRAIARASAGQEPAFIVITPDNQYALVLNRRSGDMAVIRVAAVTAKRTRSAPLFTVIPVGSRPVSVAVRHL
jgi:YVTN family beta-propeller protein